MNKLLLSGLLLVPGLTLAQAPVSYTITGRVGQLNAPAKVYLMRGAVLDSATLKNGAFVLKGRTDFPQQADLVLRRDGRRPGRYDNPKEHLRLFLDSGPVTVASPDSLHHATLRGGPVTADYQRMLASRKPLEAKIQALGAEVAKATPAERESPAFAARMQTAGTALMKESMQHDLAFIKANPNSWVSLELLGQTRMMLPAYAEIAPVYAALSPTLKATPLGREYGQLLEGLKATAVGAPAPEFSQQTPDGRTVSLRDYRGKYVLVDFWASWCGPCRQENPNVLRAYQQYKARNFEVLGVSLDDTKSRDKWVKAIQEDQLPWTQISDLQGWQNQAARRYSVQGIPQNFLIDPQGKIVAVNLRGEELHTTLARLLK